jgi:hypothetical protein
MKIREKLVKIVEVQREDIEDRIIEFHQDMVNDSIAAGAKINGDELIWQLKEFTKNLERIKKGNFKEIMTEGYLMCALGSKCSEYVDSFFHMKEKIKDVHYQDQEIMIRIMDGEVFVQDIKESDIDY